MNPIKLYLGLDVHKNSIVVATTLNDEPILNPTGMGRGEALTLTRSSAIGATRSKS